MENKLNLLTIGELRTIAKKYSLKDYHTLDKKHLVDLLKNITTESDIPRYDISFTIFSGFSDIFGEDARYYENVELETNNKKQVLDFFENKKINESIKDIETFLNDKNIYINELYISENVKNEEDFYYTTYVIEKNSTRIKIKESE